MGSATRTVEDRTTLKHEWAKFTMTPVEIIVDDGGEAIILVEPQAEVDADAGSAYGCTRCHLPLGEGLNQLCTPEE
jgi:hypothetical protein